MCDGTGVNKTFFNADQIRKEGIRTRMNRSSIRFKGKYTQNLILNPDNLWFVIRKCRFPVSIQGVNAEFYRKSDNRKSYREICGQK